MYTTDPRLKVSSYLKTGQGTLTAVANLNLEEVQAGLRFDPQALGLEHPRVLSVVAAQAAEVHGDRLSLGPGGRALLRCGCIAE